MKSILLFTIPFLLIASFRIFQKNPDQKTVIKPDELKNWVTFLSSDEMKGRANGSPEMKTAALWIAGIFEKTGLKPFQNTNGYIQNYSYISRQKNIEEENVIGFIEGADPELKDEYIFISAHYDHIGIRKVAGSDSICNGADDNAAGTCTLLGIAKTILTSGIKPGRTIVFCAFSGEESGMRGSRYYVANPLFPLKNIYVNLNFEMTGHSEYLGRNYYYMTGCSYSDLDDIIGKYNTKSDWKLIDTISLANNLFFASDNIAFSRITSKDGKNQGIPSGTFATSALAEYLHSPSDEVKLFDFENMANLVNYFSDLVIWLSHNKEEITWTDPKFSNLQ